MFKWLKDFFKTLDNAIAFGGYTPPPVPPPSYYRAMAIAEYKKIAMEALLIHEGTSLSAQEIVDKAHEIAVLMVDKKID